MGTFKVGEIVVFQGLIIESHLNGKETTIVAFEKNVMVQFIDGSTEMGDVYYVDEPSWGDGKRVAFPHNLRRRRPPEKTTGELRIMSLFVQPYVRIPEEAKQ